MALCFARLNEVRELGRRWVFFWTEYLRLQATVLEQLSLALTVGLSLTRPLGGPQRQSFDMAMKVSYGVLSHLAVKEF